MSDHAVLFPKPVRIDVQGKAVTVRPVQLRHFEDFSAAATGLIALMADATPLNVYAYAQQSGALRSILGECTSLSAWQIRRLPAATAIELMVHVLLVNSSFFGQALLALTSQQPGQMSHSN